MPLSIRPLTITLTTSIFAAATFIILTTLYAKAKPTQARIYSYYDSHHHLIGQLGESCNGGIIDWGNHDIEDGGYYKSILILQCFNSGSTSHASCYGTTASDNIKLRTELQQIPCTQLPGVETLQPPHQ